jgi:hypothetical protein
MHLRSVYRVRDMVVCKIQYCYQGTDLSGRDQDSRVLALGNSLSSRDDDGVVVAAGGDSLSRASATTCISADSLPSGFGKGPHLGHQEEGPQAVKRRSCQTVSNQSEERWSVSRLHT